MLYIFLPPPTKEIIYNGYDRDKIMFSMDYFLTSYDKHDLTHFKKKPNPSQNVKEMSGLLQLLSSNSNMI